MSYVICEQQRRSSACASAQSDQRLCFSLLRLYNISRVYSRNFETLLATVAAQAGLSLAWSETPEDTFCRVVAQLCIYVCSNVNHDETNKPNKLHVHACIKRLGRKKKRKKERKKEYKSR